MVVDRAYAFEELPTALDHFERGAFGKIVIRMMANRKVTHVLDLIPKTTALIVIDLQQGILSSEPIPFGRDEIVARSAALGRAAAEAGGVIMLTTTDFAPGYADAPAGKADAPWALPTEGLPDSFATLVPEIEALPAAVRIHQTPDERLFRR